MKSKNRYKRVSIGNLSYRLYWAKQKGHDLANLDLIPDYRYDFDSRCAPFFDRDGIYLDRELNICWIEYEGNAYIIRPYDHREYNHVNHEILCQSDPILSSEEKGLLYQILRRKNFPGKLKKSLLEFLENEMWKRESDKPSRNSPRFRLFQFMKEKNIAKKKKEPLPLP
jgi:hypothetical protein